MAPRKGMKMINTIQMIFSLPGKSFCKALTKATTGNRITRRIITIWVVPRASSVMMYMLGFSIKLEKIAMIC